MSAWEQVEISSVIDLLGLDQFCSNFRQFSAQTQLVRKLLVLIAKGDIGCMYVFIVIKVITYVRKILPFYIIKFFNQVVVFNLPKRALITRFKSSRVAFWSSVDE